MSNAAQLLNARKQLKSSANDNTAPSLRPVPTTPRSVAEFHAQLDAQAGSPAPRAEESLAQAKNYFTRDHKASEFRMAFGSLSHEERALVLIAARIDHNRCTQQIRDFNQQERTAIVDGIKLLNKISNRFSNAVGNLKNLSSTLVH
ncbi:hypothetical protein [Enterovibrio norvegicus]|uniref:hypothetical protein n=1 Tax=Enterovibrio norvegicus TaxID=188144 RepID=UPI000C82CFEA|nr:hypothetical protein [Enterovibrio norvegicus]PMN68391.1 hypothetical protein BCT27_23605 [Enterovibrio norvegicus]